MKAWSGEKSINGIMTGDDYAVVLKSHWHLYNLSY